MMNDLFSVAREPKRLGPGALFLPGQVAKYQDRLVQSIHSIVERAPLRQLTTPGGRRFSVQMTNCGALGWYSDKQGYRYESRDPLTGRAWPPIPTFWSELAQEAAASAGFQNFCPQACLINRYGLGAGMGLHQDRDERALDQPIVSISLGVGGIFLFGGLKRQERATHMRVESGDVVVWGGPSRLAYHGVRPLPYGNHPLTGETRWNLTFRCV